MPTSNRSSGARRIARRLKMTPEDAQADRARLAMKKRRQRFRRYFEREYGRYPSGPDDEKDVRRMMRGHPTGCPCFDCNFGPEECEPALPKVVRTAVRPT